jgi:catechol 2,3-dioxygenase-like lactoylglutathione lyase family enzyme
MKRLHIHISVGSLQESRHFYTALFGSEPTKIKDDYLQWILDDPYINFAISSGRAELGLNHLGIQVESDDALEVIENRLIDADIRGEKQDEAQCCYAQSKKYWIEDPQHVIWENYHTSQQIEVFGGDHFTGGVGCCQPSFSTNGKWSTGGSCS